MTHSNTLTLFTPVINIHFRLSDHKFSPLNTSSVQNGWPHVDPNFLTRFDLCVHNRLSTAKKPKAHSEDQSRQMVPSSAIVKALLVQHSGTLWIGTKAGHILLVEVSSCQLLQTISPHCHSLCCMASVLLDTLNRKNVILVLGRRQRMAQDQIKTQVPAEDSVLTVWSSSLPLESRDLIRHCELRDKITSKMRETLHNWSASLCAHHFLSCNITV